MNKSCQLISKRLACTFILLSFVFSAAALHAETITYKDKLGRTVSVSLPVRRAVFFQTYELIPALGVWDKVVGIGRYAYTNDLMKAARPDIEKTVPSAGSGIDINMEALLKLKPDIVITWTSRPEQVRFMEEKGLRVIAVYPDSLSELYEVMEFHGKIFEKEKEIKRTIVSMDGIFSSIKKRVAKIQPDKRQKVLWISSRPNSVACHIGVTNDILTMIGGINPASSIPQRNADVSIERIIEWNPDVIFIWGNAKYNPQDIMRNPQWRSINAVRSGRVFKAPEWSTWSPRLAPVALWMAMKTYPQHFRDINFDATADVFYKKVYGISYRMVARIEN
ncbi:MAG TPA: ABC transporter substrate-binding protein [Syntrophales bacterium]|nr:ABC transporter substrate-binding protein [Syntrophales bacterium]